MSEPASPASAREATIQRYSHLAQLAAGGGLLDCEADAFTGGCFGAAAYTESDEPGVPETALRASLGCGNPLAVAGLAPARRCWTSAPAAAWTCCC
ncbi:hypothetical protein ABZ260_03955 [Streptosporangium sp. NPDC006013]|uniref:hypothetical protein n=1 Tax=Streptosporangium sp. NPDC006013 TaxID=3155596 RepID=UPI0033A7FE9B